MIRVDSFGIKIYDLIRYGDPFWEKTFFRLRNSNFVWPPFDSPFQYGTQLEIFSKILPAETHPWLYAYAYICSWVVAIGLSHSRHISIYIVLSLQEKKKGGNLVKLYPTLKIKLW